MRPLVRTTVSVGAHLSGFTRLVAARYRGRGMIFALHSVVDDDTFYPDHTLRCPTGQLEWGLRWLRDEGVDFVSLDEAVRRLTGENPRPFACLTFDDGYADNLTRVLPIMERFNAPFTVFVTTGMITREIDAWWFGLAELVRSQRRIELPGLAFANRAEATVTGADVTAQHERGGAIGPALKNVWTLRFLAKSMEVQPFDKP